MAFVEYSCEATHSGNHQQLPYFAMSSTGSIQKGWDVRDMNAQEVNKQIRELCKHTLLNGNWPKDIGRLWPELYPPFRKHCLLFVGLNPSYSSNSMKRFEQANFDPRISKATDLDDEEKAARLVTVEVNGRRNIKSLHPYFAPFVNIAEDVLGSSDKWEHIDLFIVRETSQNTIKANFLNAKTWNSFATEQLDICWNIISGLLPLCIIVNGALPSDIIFEIHGKNIISHNYNRLGYHLITIGAKQVPIFFTGMLTGQRQLDKYSRKRLTWHIKQAVNNSAG